MSWKMSKLLTKLANTQDQSTPNGLGTSKRMITQAKAYLQKSKQKGGEEHPKFLKIDSLEEVLATTSDELACLGSLMQAKTMIQDAEK